MEKPEGLDQKMAELVGNGFFDLKIDVSGEVVYQMSDDAELIDPPMYKLFMHNITEELLEQIKVGHLEYRLNDDLDMEYRLTPTGISYLKSVGVLEDDFEPNYEE